MYCRTEWYDVREALNPFSLKPAVACRRASVRDPFTRPPLTPFAVPPKVTESCQK